MSVLGALRALLKKMGSSASSQSVVEALNEIGAAEGSQASAANNVAEAIRRIADAYSPPPPGQSFNGVTFGFDLGADDPETHAVMVEGCGIVWDTRDPARPDLSWTAVEEFQMSPNETRVPMNVYVSGATTMGVRAFYSQDGQPLQTEVDAAQGAQRVYLGQVQSPSQEPFGVYIRTVVSNGQLQEIQLELYYISG